MTLFSKRYQQALIDKSVVVATMPARARQRVWMAMNQFNQSWDTVDETNWQSYTSYVAETETLLEREYGEPQLVAYQGAGDQRGPVDFETFIHRCRPSQFLDIVEAYYGELEPGQGREHFEREANRIFQEEGIGWRMSGGQVFQLDSEFLNAEVLARTQELLGAHGYAGALDEFLDARGELTAGETREAIAKAQAAMESAMKTILGAKSGNAKQLIGQLGDAGFFDDLPPETRAAFQEQVLMCLPTLGNRLGRHGQGAEVVEVPRHYAELAVHVAGSFIRYLVERHLVLQEQLDPEPTLGDDLDLTPVAFAGDDFPAPADDDIPF